MAEADPERRTWRRPSGERRRRVPPRSQTSLGLSRPNEQPLRRPARHEMGVPDLCVTPTRPSGVRVGEVDAAALPLASPLEPRTSPVAVAAAKLQSAGDRRSPGAAANALLHAPHDVPTTPIRLVELEHDGQHPVQPPFPGLPPQPIFVRPPPEREPAPAAPQQAPAVAAVPDDALASGPARLPAPSPIRHAARKPAKLYQGANLRDLAVTPVTERAERGDGRRRSIAPVPITWGEDVPSTRPVASGPTVVVNGKIRLPTVRPK